MSTTDRALDAVSDTDAYEETDDEDAVERLFQSPIYTRMSAAEHDAMHAELAFMCDACIQGYQVFGYVYVARNALFGHLLKLGATMRTPARLLRELSGASAPEPFELVAYAQSPNPFALERTIRAHFAEVRTYGRRREFFALTREAAVAYFKSLGGQDAAERAPPAAASHKRKAP